MGGGAPKGPTTAASDALDLPACRRSTQLAPEHKLHCVTVASRESSSTSWSDRAQMAMSRGAHACSTSRASTDAASRMSCLLPLCSRPRLGPWLRRRAGSSDSEGRRPGQAVRESTLDRRTGVHAIVLSVAGEVHAIVLIGTPQPLSRGAEPHVGRSRRGCHAACERPSRAPAAPSG